MRSSSFLILATTAVISILIWTLANKPYNFIEAKYPVNSLSFNPYRADQSPLESHILNREQIEEDFKVIQGKTKMVRLYSSLMGSEFIPEIAGKYEIDVVACAFLQWGKDYLDNGREIDSVIRLARKNKNVTKVILGNETQLQKTVPKQDLIDYLRYARKLLKTPVSTAEPWDYWVNNPDMVKEVDFIALHILPYWQELPVEEAAQYVIDRYYAVKTMFPKKEVFIAEAGWPSDGPQKGAAVPSVANQADFIRKFTVMADQLKIDYSLIEAFDQPWKSANEGRAGEHWGLMDAFRNDKFPVHGPVLEDPKWQYWAASSTVLGLFTSAIFVFRRRNLRKRGVIFSIIVFQLSAAALTLLVRELTNQYMAPGDIVFWTIMISLQAVLALIFITDAVEVTDVVGHKPLKNYFLPSTTPMEKYPMVSLHLACCKEPPEMVIATIDSLSRLDYPDFEVIVVDNNTPDPSLWEPVKKRCEELGAHFRFFTLGSYPGFKAGALNFALAQADPRAKVIGVVDADYVVESNWLKGTVPYFNDLDVGLVQAPQEHRAWEESLFQMMENDEYSGFFRIGMVQRNEDNAIIQHGTMTLINAEILKKLGGWATWCICEDSELGLRILNEGMKAIYLDHAFGHGLVPDSYEAYAKQRFRWAYGAMRILRGHWKKLLGWSGNLTRAQRYHFVKGWLPWMGDALHMVFTFTALIWSGVLLFDPRYTDFPEPIFVYPALALVILRIVGTIWTYATRVKIGKKRTLLAMIAGGSLTHKIAKAVFQGLFTNSLPFYRTPKMDVNAPILKSLLQVSEEFLLTLALFLAAFGMVTTFGTINRQAIIWVIALIVQSFPYLAAIAAALVSGASQMRRKYKVRELKTV